MKCKHKQNLTILNFKDQNVDIKQRDVDGRRFCCDGNDRVSKRVVEKIWPG